jgi:hypothetical protein
LEPDVLLLGTPKGQPSTVYYAYKAVYIRIRRPVKLNQHPPKAAHKPVRTSRKPPTTCTSGENVYMVPVLSIHNAAHFMADFLKVSLLSF